MLKFRQKMQVSTLTFDGLGLQFEPSPTHDVSVGACDRNDPALLRLNSLRSCKIFQLSHLSH